MCLSTVYRGRQKKDALAKLPESGYYWKVVKKKRIRYWPCVYSYKAFKEGWNVTRAQHDYEDYPVAFHLYKSKWIAEKAWCINRWTHYRVIRCKVKKKDIVAIGRQDRGIVIVTTRFWCPKPSRR